MKPLILFSTVAVLSSAAFAQEVARIEISISKDGIVALAGKSVSLAELTQYLTAIAKKEKIPEVVIMSSAETPLKATTAVLDVCRQSGITKIRLQAR